MLVMLLGGASAYSWRDSGRVETATLERDAAGPRLRVRIIGDPTDPRVPPAREAIAYWNRELLRLGRRIHFDSATIHTDSIPDELLRGASGEAVFGRGPATTRLLETLSNEPADIVIALSQTDLISFSVRWREEVEASWESVDRTFHHCRCRRRCATSSRTSSGTCLG